MLENNADNFRHLLVIRDGSSSHTVTLEDATYSIGRGADNSIIINNFFVSKQQAFLLPFKLDGSDRYYFRLIDGDLQGKRSTNGTWINGNKCLSHNLQDGDVLQFGPQTTAKYYTVSNLSLKESFEVEQVEDVSAFLKQSPHWQRTQVATDEEFKELSEVALARLASFPELIPLPLVEIDTNGIISYLNPAAERQFPDLKREGKTHPLLITTLKKVANSPNRSWTEEVCYKKSIFEQVVHYFPESNLLRIFFRDITRQKCVEFELRRRDSLSQAVADVSHRLLVETNWQIATERTLALVGEVLKANYVFLWEKDGEVTAAEQGLLPSWEWKRDSDNRSPRPSQFLFSDRSDNIAHWLKLLSQGQLVQERFISEPGMPPPSLGRERIGSLLLVPLQLNGECWGALGVTDGRSQRVWSNSEQTALMSISASLSSASIRQKAEEKVRHQSLHDSLTGLPNRLLFDRQLDLALGVAGKNQEKLAVIFVDLDHFKTINDTLGHGVGDRLLQVAARRLQNCLRPGDLVSRWGGDEFTVLLSPIQGPAEVTPVAQRVLQVMKEPFTFDGQSLDISASLGIALLNDSNREAETLVKQADIALYRAKAAGKNTYEFYIPLSEQTNSEVFLSPAMRNLEKELEQALERQELVLHYQPRINLKTGRVVGFEALLRWPHSQLGFIPPDQFIPIAEKTGLIIPIGAWVIQQACRQNRAWQEAGLPSVVVSVNLSPLQLSEANLSETIVESLALTQLKPNFLELEITETCCSQSLSLVESILQPLRQMGVLVSLDDFGSGHSSLSRLHQLPVDHIKIDRAFLQEVPANERLSHILSALVDLGTRLGINLTAEGIETEEQLAFLQFINCREGQGFLFSPAVPAEQAAQILQQQFLRHQALPRTTKNLSPIKHFSETYFPTFSKLFRLCRLLPSPEKSGNSSLRSFWTRIANSSQSQAAKTKSGVKNSPELAMALPHDCKRQYPTDRSSLPQKQ